MLFRLLTPLRTKTRLRLNQTKAHLSLSAALHLAQRFPSIAARLGRGNLCPIFLSDPLPLGLYQPRKRELTEISHSGSPHVNWSREAADSSRRTGQGRLPESRSESPIRSQRADSGGLSTLYSYRRAWRTSGRRPKGLHPQSLADTATEQRGFHPDQSNLYRTECTHPGRADGGGLRVESTTVW